MKLYAITLKPTSGFGTLLKGDTLFGHFCWQAAYDAGLVEGGLKKQIALYPEKPFVIFSSAFFKLKNDKGTTFALKRPDLPFSCMLPAQTDKATTLRERKEFKKKKWILLDEKLNLDVISATFMSDKELIEKIRCLSPRETRRKLDKTTPSGLEKMFSQPHNTINRMTQTTGTGMFAPYAKENLYYFPGTSLVIFVLVEESATDIERVKHGLKRIGSWGFGRDATTGLGRFKIEGAEEIYFPETKHANACYTLSPCVPEKNCFKEVFFSPFIRYGKHGDRLACHGNPFKNPVIMADEGAVFIPDDSDLFMKPYIGKPACHVSKAMPETVVQGYSPYLPLKLEI